MVMGSSPDERAGFEVVYRRHYRAVAGFLGRRLSADVVDDATSEVFMVAWRRRTTHPTPGIGRLLGIARNVVRTQYRDRARLPVLIDDAKLDLERSEPHHAETVATRLDLLQAINRLSDADRETLLLIAWEGLSTEEAAVAADCSPGAFRVRLSRARQRLRVLLDDITDHPAHSDIDRSAHGRRR